MILEVNVGLCVIVGIGFKEGLGVVVGSGGGGV